MIQLVTGKHLGDILKVAPMTLCRYRKKGMPHIKLNCRTIRYSLPEVMQWLSQNGTEKGDCVTRLVAVRPDLLDETQPHLPSSC